MLISSTTIDECSSFLYSCDDLLSMNQFFLFHISLSISKSLPIYRYPCVSTYASLPRHLFSYIHLSLPLSLSIVICMYAYVCVCILGAVVWYTLDIEVTSPQPESSIAVTAQVRGAVAVEITLGA